MSIDRRPQNGMLYGLGYNSTTGALQLYLISLRGGGLATAVGATGSFVDISSNPARVGVDSLTKIGMDFNPVADRIRVVTSNGQNFRINPNTGAFVDGDLGGGAGSVSGVNMDGSVNTGTSTVGECAYTSNQPSVTITTLYTVDASTDSLFIQNPPNAGTQTSSSILTFNSAPLDIVEVRGLDIPEGVSAASSNAAVSSGSAYAVLEFASDSQQKFCEIDLTDGAVSNASVIDDGSDSLLGLAVQSSSDPAMIALSASGSQLIRFRASTPGTTTTISISGVGAGETLVGIDFRPATGELIGLGINATANTGTLYRLDPQSGSATAIGSSGQIAFVDGSSSPVDFPDPASVGYGLDFNPTADRIRVVTSTGLNFRLNPSTGAPVDGAVGTSGVNTDGSINGATTVVNGVGYTNSYGGAVSTVLYTLDASNNALYTQNPPNNGTQNLVASVTLGGNPLDFGAQLGMDMPPFLSNSLYAVLTVGGVTSLYTIDLTTAAVTNIGAIGAGSTPVMGLAVGDIEAR